MKMAQTTITAAVSLAFVLAWTAVGPAQQPTPRPATLRDLFWVWATPERAKPGNHDVETFADASAPQRAQLLDVPNVIMAGEGLPNDDRLAERWTREVAHLPRIVWEISADQDSTKPFVYEHRIAQLARLVPKYPQIQGVLLDDMSSVGIDKGFKPEHIRRIRQLLDESHVPATLWGVLYTMNFARPNIDKYIQQLDVISLWVWHAREIVDLEKHVAWCESHFPGKPIVLGLYMYDYGENRPMPRDLMVRQCETARTLALAGRVQGVVFLTINNDPHIVRLAADFIHKVGSEPLPAQPSHSDKTSNAKTLALHIGDGRQWHFVAGQGPWKESSGVIRPPDQRNLHSRAFYTAASYGDLEAELELNANYRETGTGAAAFIFRATDVNHGYMLYIPWGGQQLRAKHFWAQLMKLEGDGYLRSLKSVWVPGVPSETDRWYKIRLEANGPSIRVSIDGRHALEVSDSSYRQGAVGLAGYGWYGFRNVVITGQPGQMLTWDTNQKIPTHAFTVGLDSSEMPSSCIAPNGDVLLAMGHRLVRSSDKGRTWTKPEALPDRLGTVTDYGNTIFRTSHGRLIAQLYQDRTPTRKVPEIHLVESTDSGHTWSDPQPASVAPDWPAIPASLVPYGPLLETADGTLVRFLLGNAGEGSQFKNVVTWSATHCKAFAIRSTDAGKSWSRPIEIDQPSWSGQPRGSIPGSLDLTEPTGVAIGNQITVLVRPVYSPYMWQCWSNDAGATWDSAARATFPGYAQSAVRTRSEAIVCAHRFPQYSVNVSRDGGLNWDEGTVIDNAVWAMGTIVEVEPDLLLATYMNYDRKQPLLAQLIRVEPSRIIPVKP